tara:strand:+ start:354 stop:695 length:342 start_codon:yes stop_codon:yes gene_type:complete
MADPIDLVKIPLASVVKDTLAKQLNIVFVKGDDCLHTRGMDIENSKWGNLSISFAEEPNDDDAVYVLLEFNDKEKIAIPFTPQVLMYFQLGLMNWLNDADDTELRKMLPDFMN